MFVIYSFVLILIIIVQSVHFKVILFIPYFYLFCIPFLFVEFLTWELFCRSLFHHWPQFIMSMLWRANMIQAFISRWCRVNWKFFIIGPHFIKSWKWFNEFKIEFLQGMWIIICICTCKYLTLLNAVIYICVLYQSWDVLSFILKI